MIDISVVFANSVGSFPNFSGKNATGAGATDGTEFIAALIDNWMWGPAQALLDHESITPNGVTEAAGASQVLDAVQKLFPPGMVAEWNLNADPGTTGHRFLLLNGQGILRANYADLDANVYVGDGNNATAAAYYHADDAAGTIRNTTGVYLILPESRGYTTRGLDLAASVDPLGASRSLGDNQLDALQLHQHSYGDTRIGYVATGGLNAMGVNPDTDLTTSLYQTDGGGTPRTSSETRMVNRSTQFAIRY
jgi:hypothetical protein